ncbi:MAG: hypothetical protein PQJ61_05575 [Spirochaetales bacterium]|uniref:Outer membrane protein beta-barrel domain-containing protein n=1 Tax=Candidatus Thalassospirochaeta sargassi TaxID=3119039 RepID=A0AAJ1IBN3_9SPIO|nr:hypothetical protein [Spirochaetales bacterium]
MRFRVLFSFILLAAIPSAGFSADFNADLEGVELIVGNAIILNAEDVSVSDAPSPIKAFFGVSVPMTFTDIFYFEPGFRVYSTYVTLETVDGEFKAVPAAVDTVDRMSVFNCEIRPELGAIFHLNEKISMGITGAPVFTLRFPLTAYDEADSDDKATIREYYYSNARFLGLWAGGFFSWSFGESTTLRLKAGTNLPVYHLWDGDDAAFYDQMIIEPEIGFVFRF